MEAILRKGDLVTRSAPEGYLREDGSCPFCECQIRLEQPEGFIYKIRLLKIFRSGFMKIKCPGCKALLRER